MISALACAMLRKLCLAAALACGLAAGTMAQAASPRIVAVGDIHGDYDAFETVLEAAGLIDESGAWVGGDAVLVQTGDVSDRGPDTRRIIAHLRRIQVEAEDAGGQVIVLSGNHEALNLIRDFRYVHDGEIAAFADENSEARRDETFSQSREQILSDLREDDPDLSDAEVRAAFNERVPLGFIEYQEAWSPDGLHGQWVKDLPAVVVLGDTLFVHGGLSALYVRYSIDEINAATALAMSAQSRDRSAIINDPNGPLWYRGLHRDSGEVVHFAGLGPLTIEEEVDLVLDAFGVDRIVVGHTPSLEGIAAAHNNRVIRIDTGMSAYYGGVISYLEIREDGVFAYPGGMRIETP